jgi:hypothetical protein
MRSYLAAFLIVTSLLMLIFLKPVTLYLCKILGWKMPELTPEQEKQNLIIRTIYQIGVSKCVFYFGLGICWIGLVFFGIAWLDRGGFNAPSFNELKPFEGIMSVKPSNKFSGYLITDPVTGKAYTCYVGCIYINIMEDVGKTVKVLIDKDRIYQVEVEGVIKKSYSNVIDVDSKRFSLGQSCIVFGVFLIFLSGLIKYREKNINGNS